ncbi:hypothetical protein EPN81_04985 [Patescibacteria group bacterium]|nr:MAG: hypothetical protein EPN81_04985 [Patescibacteria group bacterium]
MKDSTSRNLFKAGIVLESAVCDALTQLGVPHRRTPRLGKEDTFDQLDLVVFPGGGRLPIEIQLTLQPKKYNKLFRFAYRALTSTMRGIRLYIEVVGSHRHAANLGMVGRRVAEAIKLIVQRFRDFGSKNLLGVRIHALSGKIEKFDLIEFCGHKLVKLVEAWWEQYRLTQEAKRAAAIQTARQHCLKPKPPPFWRAVLRDPIAFLGTRAVSGRPSHHINNRTFFMPRRFC